MAYECQFLRPSYILGPAQAWPSLSPSSVNLLLIKEDVGEEGESDEDVKGDKEEDSDPEFPEELGFLDNNRGRHESDEGDAEP